ncbi:MAG: hypothetical protein NT157_04640 [Candidatus Micrarchaeota archaeon]|nr:hypothetical protein [Candidatus Micrarchaeota archaeon]
MELDRNQKTLIGAVLLIAIVAAIVYLPAFLNQNVPTACMIDGECQHEQALVRLNNLAPIIFSAGVVIGLVVFYFLYERRKTPAESRKSLAEVADMLDASEAKVMRKIIDEKGRVLQAELSRLEGIGKVKAHRIIGRLEKRGVIQTEGAGKTNVIKLTDKYRKIFFE